MDYGQARGWCIGIIWELLRRKSLKMPVSDPGGDAEQEVGCLCLGLRRKVRSV